MNTSQSKQEGLFNSRLLVILGGIIFLIVAVGYFFYGLQPTIQSDSEKVDLRISEGDSFREIAAVLSQESLIRSISVFKFYALASGSARKFKPGIYELSNAMSVPDIIQKLTEGGKTQVSVTIPEGLTIKDIDRLLANSEVIERGSLASYQINTELVDNYSFLDNVASLEGFLFPDTYKFKLNSTAEEVIYKFLDNFQEKGWSNIKNNNNWYDILTLASFLEREVKTLEDRKVVAGILMKRLGVGMPLQVDATISYAKCNRSYLGCENIQITRSDLEMATPYNTYKRIGWTPTPISNPGETALKAASNPIPTSYWYYLSSSDSGETIFSRSLEEHNVNRSKHL